MQDLVVRLNNGETPQINLLSSLNISNLWKFFSFPKHNSKCYFIINKIVFEVTTE